jgi:hypothetical protein
MEGRSNYNMKKPRPTQALLMSQAPKQRPELLYAARDEKAESQKIV